MSKMGTHIVNQNERELGMLQTINEQKYIEKPWGHELLIALTDKYAGKILYVKKGHRISLQYHQFKDETIYVAEGGVTVQLNGDDNSVFLPIGCSIHIEPNTHHRIYALTDSLIIEVSTPELDDVIRIQDDYERT